MAGERIIHTGGGSYNESVQGNSINVQGNYIINHNADLDRLTTQIQQYLTKLRTQGYSDEQAQKEVAIKLANKAKSSSDFKARLASMSKYVGDAAANGLLGEAAVQVLKIAFQLAGIPIS